MDNIFEKISLTLILLKIFDIYFFCYLATNEKIVITHLRHATVPQTMDHLIAKDKVAEQHTVEPRLSEPSGRHTIRPDNRGVRIDEGNRNSPSIGYRVGDN